MSIASGKVVGRYRVGREVGRGGFAAVYFAFDEREQRPVALKVLHDELSEQPDLVQRFRREAATLLRLAGHPHIVRVFTYGQLEGSLYVAMEFVEGHSLPTPHGEPAAPDLSARIAAGVGSALDAAHAIGVVHRDVKPSNVLLGADSRIVLTDFGIAGLVASQGMLTRPDLLMGTPEYLPPEVVRGETFTAAGDQYALAVLVYGLLTGALPFRGETPLALLYAHVHEAPPAPSTVRAGLPGAVDAPLRQALAKDPRQRFATCREFASAMAAALGVSVEIAPPTTVGSTLDVLVSRAKELAQIGYFDAALRTLDAAVKLLPGDPRVRELEEVLREERRLAERYKHAQALLRAREWGGAREVLNSIYVERPDYRDVAELRRKTLHELTRVPTRTSAKVRPLGQQNARALADLGYHDAAVQALEAAEELLPGDPRLDDLEAKLREERRLAERYRHAVSLLRQKEFGAARSILNAIHSVRPDYREVQRLRRHAFAGLLRKTGASPG